MGIRINIPILRARQNRLTQTKLAKLANISQRTISRLETGHSKGIDFNTLEHLCQALNCQPGDLLIYIEEDIKTPLPVSSHQLPIIGNDDDEETMKVLKKRRLEAIQELKKGKTIPFHAVLADYQEIQF